MGEPPRTVPLARHITSSLSSETSEESDVITPFGASSDDPSSEQNTPPPTFSPPPSPRARPSESLLSCRLPANPGATQVTALSTAPNTNPYPPPCNALEARSSSCGPHPRRSFPVCRFSHGKTASYSVAPPGKNRLYSRQSNGAADDAHLGLSSFHGQWTSTPVGGPRAWSSTAWAFLSR